MANPFLDKLKELASQGLNYAIENRPSFGYSWGPEGGELLAAQAHARSQDRGFKNQQKLIDEKEKRANRIALAGVTLHAGINSLPVEKQGPAFSAVFAGKPTGDEQIDSLVNSLQQRATMMGLTEDDMGMVANSYSEFKKRLTEAEKDKTKLLTPEEEAQKIRIAQQSRVPEQSKLLTPEEEAQRIRIAKESRPSEKPDKPHFAKDWIYNAEGTMKYPARRNLRTGEIEPLSKGGKWVKVSKGEETISDTIDQELGEDVSTESEKTPEGLDEGTIQYNMKKYGKTRQEVIDKYKKSKGGK